MGTLAGTMAYAWSKRKEQSRQDAPDWARGYMSDIAARASEESQRGYTPYTGQRQQGFNQDQQNAFGIYRNQAQGSPEMQAGSNALLGWLGQQSPSNPFFGSYTPQLRADNMAVAQMNSPMTTERVNNPYLMVNSPNASNSYIGDTSKGVSGAPSVLDYALKGASNNPFIGMTTQGISSVPTVAAGTNAVLGMNNPYLSGAINSASEDITRNYNLTTAPQMDSLARASGSFGNTGVDQMRLESQRNLAKELGGVANNMRMQDYALQANLGEQDVNRRMQADQLNTGNAMDAQRFNSQAQANDIARNLSGYSAQNAANFGNVLDAAKFDAANSLNSQQFNASLGNNDLTRNASLLQELSKFNVGNQVNDVRQMQNLTNNNLQFNATNANDASRFNSSSANDLAKFNAANSNDFAKFNANNYANDLARNGTLYDNWSGNRNGLLGQALNYDTQRNTNAGGLLDIGNRQQNYGQTGMDQKYQDWMDQQNWNQNNLNWGANLLSQLTRGYGEGAANGSKFGWDYRMSGGLGPNSAKGG